MEDLRDLEELTEGNNDISLNRLHMRPVNTDQSRKDDSAYSKYRDKFKAYDRKSPPPESANTRTRKPGLDKTLQVPPRTSFQL